MAKILGGRHSVPREEVVLAQAFRLDALLKVLERPGMVWKAEALGEIQPRRANAVMVR